jgi:PAS domain S-box-containing protein
VCSYIPDLCTFSNLKVKPTISDVLAGGWAKALSGDRKQFYMFFDKMLDGFAYHKIVVDKSGKPVDYVFVKVNHAFERMTGLKRAQIIGKKVTDVLVGIERDPADWIGIYGKVALTGEPVQFENHAEPLDKWFKVSAYCPEKGYFVALFEDITERKKTEDSIRQSEQRYRSLYEAVSGGVVVQDQNGSIIEANDKAREILGLTPDQMQGRTSTDPNWHAIHEDNSPFPGDQHPAMVTLRTGKALQNVVMGVFQPNTSQYRWIIINSEPIIDAKTKKVTAVVTTFVDITDLKKTEDALRLSEERFSKAFSLSPFAVIMTRLNDGTYVDVNDTFLKMFEFSRNEVIGHTANEIKIYAKPDGRAAYLAAFKDGNVKDFEVDLKTKTGKPIKALGYAKIINVIGQDLTIGTLIDITDRKKAEEALQQQKAIAQQERDRLSSLLNSITDEVWFADTEKKFTLANPSAINEFKLDSSIGGVDVENLAKSIEVLRPDGSPRPVEEAPPLRALKGEIIRNQEEIIRTPATGELRTRQVSSAPVRDVSGAIIGAVSVVRDITELKKAEEATARQAELIDLSPDAIIVRKLDGTITFWSKGAEKLYGWRKDEALGQVIHTLLMTEFPQSLKEVLKKLKLDGKWSGEISHTCKNGDKVVVQSYWLGKFNAQGEIVEMMESNVDITERIRMQANLEESAVVVEEYANQMEELANKRAEQLKEAERLAAIGATAGMVGHDIRNPLQSITGDLYIAKTDLAAIPDGEEKNNVQDSLSEIEKNIDYINKIVADLQDFARPLKPNLEETDLKLVIDDLLKKNGLPENIKVSVEVEIEARKVVADSTFINRIMNNLVNNAVQAMPKGGKLTIRAFKEANDAVITVKDTGVGIPEAVKGKLFTPMFTTKAKGQGFGLAVVKRMSEALGGSVAFESQEGKGTTFIVRFHPKS